MSNYIEQINKKYQHPVGIDKSIKEKVFDPLEHHITSWAYRNNISLTDVKLSGSRAKGTAISMTSDMDVFIYLSLSNTDSLKNVYNSLYEYFASSKVSNACVRQSVSIGVRFNGMNIDLIPGQRLSDYHGDHSLYKSERDICTHTNIDKHIKIVRNSFWVPEMVAAKIWRHCHKLSFPSILVELVTIEALNQKGTTDHDKNFVLLLGYLKDKIQTVKIIDPANNDNIISDDITPIEKKKIAEKAKDCRTKKLWTEILW